MKQCLSLLILLILYSCNSQPSINKEALSKELEEIYQLDQKYRKAMGAVHQEYGFNSPEMNELLVKQQRIDSANLQRVMKIIEQVGGYPGKSLVGQSASEVTFFVLQHAPDSVQERYYDMIINAAKNKELNVSLAAMYQDRYLMHRGKPQIYGTQIRSEYRTDANTGARMDTTYVWPIADTTKIDSLRMWNGLGPLEEYLNKFGISRWE